MTKWDSLWCNWDTMIKKKINHALHSTLYLGKKLDTHERIKTRPISGLQNIFWISGEVLTIIGV